MERHIVFMVLARIAICAEGFLGFLGLFRPGLRYKISSPGTQLLDSDHSCRTVEAVTDAKLRRQTRFEVLTNGERFCIFEHQK